MGNIVITTCCNHNCSYCFARPMEKDAAGSTAFMSMELFQQSIDFLSLSGIQDLNILGGEPTLHPDFCELTQLALKQFQTLTVFTNGDMTARSRAYLASLPKGRVTITVNLTDCSPLPSNVKKTLSAIGCKGMAGVTIYQPDMTLEYLFSLIDKYGLSRRIRLGIAHPGLKTTIGALAPHNYFRVGENIKVFARQAQQFGVRVFLDCGFVPCMFGKEAISPAIGLCCEPIPDILPDGKIIHCFPCAEQDNYHISDFNHISEAKNKLIELLAPYREAGIFESCGECRLRAENKCLGGCRGTAMKRLANIDFTNE